MAPQLLHQRWQWAVEVAVFALSEAVAGHVDVGAKTLPVVVEFVDRAALGALQQAR